MRSDHKRTPPKGWEKGEKMGKNLTPQQRRFVLRSIAEYKTDDQIAAELKATWDIDRSPSTIKVIYRYSKNYAEQIAKYRKSFNAREGQHALNNKQVVMDYLQKGMDIAITDRDGKALASLINQLKDINGWNKLGELEINHTSTGAGSIEDVLKQLLNDNQQTQAIDAQVEPLPNDLTLPALPSGLPADPAL